MSCINIVFDLSILGHIALQDIRVKVGLKTKESSLMHPIKIMNDNKRDIEISQSETVETRVEEIGDSANHI